MPTVVSVGLLLFKALLHGCFPATVTRSLLDTEIPVDVSPSLPVSSLPLLGLHLHLTPNSSTVSSCVSLGSVSTADFSVTRSWTPSRSQMCWSLKPKQLGLGMVLSPQRAKPPPTCERQQRPEPRQGAFQGVRGAGGPGRAQQPGWGAPGMRCCCRSRSLLSSAANGCPPAGIGAKLLPGGTESSPGPTFSCVLTTLGKPSAGILGPRPDIEDGAKW